jgi:hypothetical protein
MTPGTPGKLALRLVFLSHSSVATMTTAVRPCLVIFCGPSDFAFSINSLNFAFAPGYRPCISTHCLTPNSPIGTSMLRNARSGGRFLNHDWRSTTSIEVLKDGNSTLKAIHPAEHPSTPATNNYCSLRLVTSSNADQRRQKIVCHPTVPILFWNSDLVSSDRCGNPAFQVSALHPS